MIELRKLDAVQGWSIDLDTAHLSWRYEINAEMAKWLLFGRESLNAGHLLAFQLIKHSLRVTDDSVRCFNLLASVWNAELTNVESWFAKLSWSFANNHHQTKLSCTQ